MRQYLDVKRQHRDALVFFRMGDFYEMFYEDALTAARVLDLTLTSRAKDASGGAIPMCGVPFHAADTYIGRLVRKGYRVAICDQVEDPRKAKGLVKREVVRVVSPGTLTTPAISTARPAFLGPRRTRRELGWRSWMSTGEFTPPGSRRRQHRRSGELSSSARNVVPAGADAAALDAEVAHGDRRLAFDRPRAHAPPAARHGVLWCGLGRPAAVRGRPCSAISAKRRRTPRTSATSFRTTPRCRRSTTLRI
jgi:hypothetical protein